MAQNVERTPNTPRVPDTRADDEPDQLPLKPGALLAVARQPTLQRSDSPVEQDAKPQPRLRAIAAHGCALAPTVLMWYFCVVLKLAIPAVFAFHALMLTLMLGFCLAFGVDISTLLPSAEEIRRTIGYCRRSFLSISIGGVAIYIGCRSGSAPGEYLGVPLGTLRELIDLFGIHAPPLPYVFFAIYFAVVNPVLEEVFWRTFLHRELRADRPLAKVLLAHDYALYHLFITSSLMPHWFSVFCAWPFLIVFGLALDRVARDERLGVVTAIGVHAGMDLAAAFWIMDLRFGWLDFLQTV